MDRDTPNISTTHAADLSTTAAVAGGTVESSNVSSIFATAFEQELTPREAMDATAVIAHRFLATRGIAEPDLAAWWWILEPAYDLPRGASSDNADPECAALARERFELDPNPTVILVPDAHTYMVIPLPSRDTSEPHTVGMFAVPLMPDAHPDEYAFSALRAMATIIAVNMENSVRALSASRSMQYAQAAARIQRQLVEPTDRARALEIAVEALRSCDDVKAVRAVMLIDGSRQEVAGFGDLTIPTDAAPEDEVPIHHFTLPVTVDDVLEAEFEFISQHELDEIEADTVGSIAVAVAGSTARSRANATIESLRRSATRRLVEAQERERSMIAADIHDGVLQQLGATAIRLELAQSRVEQSDFSTASSIIADGANEIRSCARELRALLMELRPQVLDDNGLNAALVELGRHVDDVDVKVTSRVPEDLGSEFSITIFRIVQEALTNIQKHAQAKTASVDVELEDSNISIDIKDDGIGYEGAVTGPSSEGSHLGLLGMRERAQMFGGTFSIAGTSGGGTSIRATLPLDGPRDDTV